MRANRKLRGFLLHDERICFDNLALNNGDPENSSYSQTAGRPGTAVAVDELGTLRPQVHHTQEQDLTVVAIRPGLPGTDTGAGLGYRVQFTSDDTICGWNEPVLVQGYRPVDWGVVTWLAVDSVTCPRSQRVVAVGHDSSSTVNNLTSWTWNPTTRDWLPAVSIDAHSGNAPTICLLKATGRLLVMVIGTVAAEVHYSDDDGQTWALYARPNPGLWSASSASTRWRMVEDGIGNLLLVGVDETTGDYWQFVSVDSGANWALVEAGTGYTRHGPRLMASGRIVMSSRQFAGQHAQWITLEDAFDPISGRANVAFDGANDVDHVATCVDADGHIYTVLSVEDSDIVKLARSTDDGGSFELYDRQVVATGGSVASPTTHRHHVRSVAASGGELVALFTSVHTATSPSTDGSLLSMVLGGWANIESPSGAGLTSEAGRLDRAGWGDTTDQDLNGIFFPSAILDDQGWAGSGTAETLVDGYHDFNAVGVDSWASRTFAGNAGGSVAVMFEAKVIAGGSAASDQMVVSYALRDGFSRRCLLIRLHEAGFVVRDDDTTTPATLATVALDMTATVYQFLLLVGGVSDVAVYYREISSSVWILAATGSLAQTANGASTDQVIVGVPAVTTARVRIGMIAWMNPPREWLTGLADGDTLDELEWGKAVGTRPYPVRDQVDVDGHRLHLSASGGVARLQERWQIAAEWDRGVREVHPVESPKPTAGWRSLDTAEQILTWDLGIDSRLGHSWALGAALIRCNFHQALIEASTDAAPTTWVQLGAYIGIVATSVTYTRSGDLIFPASGTPPGALFWGAGALKGGQAILDPFNVPACCRRIAWNQGGGWVEHGVQAVLRIEGLDGTEPTSGTMHIVAPSAVLVMHSSAPFAYRRIRLRIPEQETPDGHFRLGKLVLGSIIPVGRQYSRGWSVRHVPLTRIEEDDDGTVFVDPRGSEVSGSYRREITTSWQDGYDDTKIRAGVAPHLSASAGTPPLVSDQDVRAQIEGFLRSSRGGSTPSVALPEIPAVSGVIFDRDLFSFGRLGAGQAWQVNNVQGDEGRSEVYRGEGLTHVELV